MVVSVPVPVSVSVLEWQHRIEQDMIEKFRGYEDLSQDITQQIIVFKHGKYRQQWLVYVNLANKRSRDRFLFDYCGIEDSDADAVHAHAGDHSNKSNSNSNNKNGVVVNRAKKNSHNNNNHDNNNENENNRNENENGKEGGDGEAGRAMTGVWQREQEQIKREIQVCGQNVHLSARAVFNAIPKYLKR